MRILVTGPRIWTDLEALRDGMDEAAERASLLYADIIILVHGNAPGFDTMCAAEADARGWQLEPHDAKWRDAGFFDKQAGHKRNQEMVNDGADLCLAGLMACDGHNNCLLPPGHLTHGTADCLSRALLAGIPLVTVRPGK